MFFKSKSLEIPPPATPFNAVHTAGASAPTTQSTAPAAIARLSDLDRKLNEVIKRLGRIEANLIDIRQGRIRDEREIH